jgi:hypothetical protein
VTVLGLYFLIRAFSRSSRSSSPREASTGAGSC